MKHMFGNKSIPRNPSENFPTNPFLDHCPDDPVNKVEIWEFKERNNVRQEQKIEIK